MTYMAYDQGVLQLLTRIMAYSIREAISVNTETVGLFQLAVNSLVKNFAKWYHLLLIAIIR